MQNKLKFLLLFFAGLFISGCAGLSEPKIYDYSAFLQSKPRSIIVLMPTNQTTEIKASSAVLAHSLYPLAEAGYYVFPMALVNDTFKHNGITEPSEIANISANKLKNIFGADAALYINVSEYGSTYMIVDSVTRVAVSATLIDLNTGATLWQKSAVAANQSANSGDLIGSMISALLKQIIDTTTDVSYDLSVSAALKLFSTDCADCILHGARSPRYGADAQLHGRK